ncbi:hypothetical protein FF1_000483 [Malus domestica]
MGTEGDSVLEVLGGKRGSAVEDEAGALQQTELLRRVRGQQRVAEEAEGLRWLFVVETKPCLGCCSILERDKLPMQQHEDLTGGEGQNGAVGFSEPKS